MLFRFRHNILCLKKFSHPRKTGKVCYKQNILNKLMEENSEKSKGRAEEMKALLAELEEMLREM